MPEDLRLDLNLLIGGIGEIPSIKKTEEDLRRDQKKMEEMITQIN